MRTTFGDQDVIARIRKLADEPSRASVLVSAIREIALDANDEDPCPELRSVIAATQADETSTRILQSIRELVAEPVAPTRDTGLILRTALDTASWLRGRGEYRAADSVAAVCAELRATLER